jgi:cyclopropane-fatty-acyl-phospholipid synthase
MSLILGMSPSSAGGKKCAHSMGLPCFGSSSLCLGKMQYVDFAILYGAYQILTVITKSKVVEVLNEKVTNWLSSMSDSFIPLIYSGLVPDFIIRSGIRLRLRDHLLLLRDESCITEQDSKMKIVQQLKTMPVAINTDEANDQHYEVPSEFYTMCLGPRKKYSSGLWPSKNTTFEESEVAMLDLYCERAQLKDGMHIVDLGCGWGSLTLHLAEKYPNCKITGISNSHSQREYILQTAKDRGYNVDNITIVTCNVSDDKGALDVVKGNDRVMSIEM